MSVFWTSFRHLLPDDHRSHWLRGQEVRQADAQQDVWGPLLVLHVDAGWCPDWCPGPTWPGDSTNWEGWIGRNGLVLFDFGLQCSTGIGGEPSENLRPKTSDWMVLSSDLQRSDLDEGEEWWNSCWYYSRYVLFAFIFYLCLYNWTFKNHFEPLLETLSPPSSEGEKIKQMTCRGQRSDELTRRQTLNAIKLSNLVIHTVNPVRPQRSTSPLTVNWSNNLLSWTRKVYHTWNLEHLEPSTPNFNNICPLIQSTCDEVHRTARPPVTLTPIWNHEFLHRHSSSFSSLHLPKGLVPFS